jgi:hypothetical protein
MAVTDRKQEVAQERSRREAGTLDRMAQMKLAIPDSIRAEHEGRYQLRWINDSGNRMHFMTEKDDYEKVNGIQPVPVGTSEDGKPIYAHLCRKPLKFFEQHQAEAMRAIGEREKGLVQAARTDPQDNRTPETSYVPAGNSISSGYAP